MTHLQHLSFFKGEMRPTQREITVLVAQAMQEYEEFYECLTKDLIFYQAFFLSLWSFFICCHKVCEFLQTLISAWLKDSLKQSKLTRLDQLVLPQKIKAPILLLESLKPCTPNLPLVTNLGVYSLLLQIPW
jgi:hypothetical protein